MAAPGSGESACVCCEKQVFSTEKCVQCRTCGDVWHCGCIGMKDAIGLEVCKKKQRGICYFCDRCCDEFRGWKGEESCEILPLDGAVGGEVESETEKMVTRGREEERRGRSGSQSMNSEKAKETELEMENNYNESERRTRSSKIIVTNKCNKCKKEVNEGEKIMCEKCELVVHSKCVGVKDNLVLQMDIQTVRRIVYLCDNCQEWLENKKRRSTKKSESEENILQTEGDGDEEEEVVSEEEENEENEEGSWRVEVFANRICQLEEENENLKNHCERIQMKMEKIILDDVLTCMATKINKLPKTEITELLNFFQKEEIGKAKELLYKECVKFGAEKDGVKYEERKKSVRRGAKEMDIEDLYGYMEWLQGHVEEEEMPMFVSANVDNMPSNKREAWVELEEVKEVMKKIEQTVVKEEEEKEDIRGQLKKELNGIKEMLKNMKKEMERRENEELRRIEGAKWKELAMEGRLDKIEGLLKIHTENGGSREERRREMQPVRQLQRVVSREERRRERQPVIELQKETRKKSTERKIQEDEIVNEIVNMEKEEEITTQEDEHEIVNTEKEEEITIQAEQTQSGWSKEEYREEEETNGESKKRKNYSDVIRENVAVNGGTRDGEEWITFGARPKRGRNNDVRRETQIPGVRASGKAAKCYIGRCNRETSEKSIHKYVEEIVKRELNQKVECMVVELKKDGVSEAWSKSYKVVVPPHVKPLIMLEKYWPRGIVIRNFFEKRWNRGEGT